MYMVECIEGKQIGIEPETQVCLNCKHFYRHYIRHGAWFTAINNGHCAYPRLKERKMLDTCIHFERAESDSK